MNISSEKSEYCVCLCPLYIVLALCGISFPNPSTCHYFRSNLESQCLKLFQVWLHCNILYNRCLFSQRCKCTSMYKGKQIEFLKEKKDQNWCTLNRHNKKKCVTLILLIGNSQLNKQNPHQLSPQEAALLSSSDIAMPVNSSLWSLVWYNSCGGRKKRWHKIRRFPHLHRNFKSHTEMHTVLKS